MQPSADALVPLLQVGLNYDPMIAKVISHGPDRLSALQTLDTALSQLQVSLVGCQPILSHACSRQQPPEAFHMTWHGLRYLSSKVCAGWGCHLVTLQLCSSC